MEEEKAIQITPDADGRYILDRELKSILLQSLKDGFLTADAINQVMAKTIGSGPRIIIGDPCHRLDCPNRIYEIR